ncbi:hypothetical protein T4C_2111 [Trichinella pseudospiralis]|nr:hypothetical protein T4C_2111 [Trichinella pseudospiralis]
MSAAAECRGLLWLSVARRWEEGRYEAVVTLELSRFHILDVAFQKYLCDVSGR